MLSDKIKGCIYGYAIGDALGIGTEFMTRPEIRHHYPNGLTSYGQIIHDAHRSQWKPGEFSFDTEQIIAMSESMKAKGGPDHIDFVQRLRELFNKISPADLAGSFRWVLSKDNFTSDPLRASMEVYETQQLFEPRNEALGRALIAGLWPRNYEKIAIDHMRVTHWDPLGVVCGVVIATMANELLYHDREADRDRLTGITLRIDDRFVPFLDTAYDGDITDFELDNQETMWSAPKAAGAALWALNHFTNAEEALYAVVNQGGDADTIASLTLALFALKYGSTVLPAHLLDGLKNKEQLGTAVNNIIQVLESHDFLLKF